MNEGWAINLFNSEMTFTEDTNNNKIDYPERYFGLFNIYAGTFDGTKLITANQYKTYINGEIQNTTKMQPARSSTSTSELLRIGNYKDYSNWQNNYSYNGDIAEIILFDEALNEDQVAEVTKYLGVKYGAITACEMPSANELLQLGYQSTCDTSAELKTVSECSQLTTCAGGYEDWTEYHPFRLICPQTGEKFVLRGCYPLDQGEGDNPSVHDPTDDQLALRILESESLFHFDPNAGSDFVDYDQSDSNKLVSIKSLPNKLGTEPTLIRKSSSGLRLKIWVAIRC